MSAARNPYQARPFRRIRTMIRRKRRPQQIWRRPGAQRPHQLRRRPRQGTKIARVIELLQRDQGARLEELIAATGWLPHTARAALTGLRHRGYDVRLERGETGRASVYRAVATLAASA